MPSALLARLVSHCRGLAAHVAAAPDAELVRRFRQSCDPDAFAELVARHAGLVWGVCRRTLPQEADAEDAFQAVFLALARSAPAIDPGRPLGGWLHAVAVRVARRALGRTLRRRTDPLPPECEGPPDIAADVAARDLYRAVDEEIARLPAALRGPVVLCCLEGRTRDEAAAALGCSVLAVKSRLERARHLLRQALGRRGIPLPAAFLVLGLGAAPVGAALKARAVGSALGSASPVVSRLAAAAVPGVGNYLFAVVAVTVVGVGVIGLSQVAPSKEPQPAAKADPPPAKEAPPLADRFGDPLPDGAVRRFGTLRFRHESVAHLAFTPDGKRLVAGVGSNALAVFGSADGRKLAQFGETPDNANYGFAPSPDGKHVYCLGSQLTKWDLATGAKVRTFADAVRCATVAVSPDGKAVAVARLARGGWAVLLDADTGKKLVDLDLKDLPANEWSPDVRGLAFSPDGKTVAGVVCESKEVKPGALTLTCLGVRLWEAATGKALATVAPAGDPPSTFTFVRDTKLLASLGRGRILHLWDTEAGEFTRTVSLPKGEPTLADLSESSNGRRAATYLRDGTVVVIDLATGKELRRLMAGETNFGPASLAVSPDGALVACSRAWGHSSVRVWEVDTGKERLADAGHRGPATLSLSADGKTLISRGAGQVFRWDLATGEGKAMPDDPAAGDGFDPDWSKLAYRTPRHRFTYESGSGRIEAHSRDGSKFVARSSCPKDHPGAAAHSADGKHFAISFRDRESTVLLWTPDQGDEPVRLSGHPAAVQQMAFTHDGKYLIAGAGQRDAYPTETVFVYEAATSKLVRKLSTTSAPGHLVLTADDRTLITGGLWNDATVRAWDLATGKELATLIDPAVPVSSVPDPMGQETPSVGGLALSADERFLAVVTGRAGSSSLAIWDTASWKPVKAFALAKSRSHAASLAVAPGGRSVFVAYPDSTILEWDVAGRTGKSAVPSSARLEELWRDLGDPSGKGYAAAWELLDHPAAAVALIRSKLAPAVAPDAAQVRELVTKLSSDSFREREEAGKKLIALGESVLPIVREAAGGTLSAEAKERLEKVIAALSGGLTPEQVRDRRAVAVLDWSNLPEADEHLRKLAGGAAGARLTVEAKGALQRRGAK